MIEDAPFFMTDLEEALLGADAAKRCETLLSRLAALDAHALCEIDAGASPARFDELVAVRVALAAAKRVVVCFQLVAQQRD